VEAAIAFLLELVREGSPSTSKLAIDALSIHSRDEQLRAQVEAAAGSRVF
jgi:hypothetical protein